MKKYKINILQMYGKKDVNYLANLPYLVEKASKNLATNLDIEEKRISDFCFIESILSWIWTIEDNLDSTYQSKYTKMLENIINE